MAKRRSQTDHDKMVKYVAKYLESNGFSDVKADISGYDQPAKITWSKTGNGHIPDVSGVGAKLNIFEVETDDSIDSDHTADQWTLFAAYAKQHNAIFYVVVPQGSKSIADKRLAELDISAEVWEVDV